MQRLTIKDTINNVSTTIWKLNGFEKFLLWATAIVSGISIFGEQGFGYSLFFIAVMVLAIMGLVHGSKCNYESSESIFKVSLITAYCYITLLTLGIFLILAEA